MNRLTTLMAYLAARHGRRFATRRALEDFQAKHLEHFLRFLKHRSPFYAEIDPKKGLIDLPIMNKATMMEHFDELNTAGIKKTDAFSVALRAETFRDFSETINGHTIGLSSGTSGNRGLFLVSPAEQALWAGILLAKILPTSLFTCREQLALFLRSSSRLYESTGRSRIQFSYYDLLVPMTDHVARLNTEQPTLIFAPPSVLRMLAESLLAGSLKISPVRLYAVAEVLEDQDRRFVSQAFGQIVHQIYQATEGFLGATCREGVMHLNEESILFEKEFFPGQSRRFVPIITDFRRRTQPIVRYRLNDVLTLRDNPCPCGSACTAIEQIEGRSDDIFHFSLSADPRGHRDVFPDFIRRAIMSASDAILEYRARQLTRDCVVIELRLGSESQRPGIEYAIVKNFSELSNSLEAKCPQVVFEPYQSHGPMTKLRRVINQSDGASGVLK